MSETASLSASTYPESIRCVVYIGSHHVEFLDRVGRQQAITRSDVMRRIIDSQMAAVRR